jgi:hypothetical protein
MDLPLGGYYLHCYFKYNPGVFHDLATANGYRPGFSRDLIRQMAANSFRSCADAGFADSKFRDFGIEIVVQKTNDAPFKIPVDNISSAVVSESLGHLEDECCRFSPFYRSIHKLLFAHQPCPFKTVHAAYWSTSKRYSSSKGLAV